MNIYLARHGESIPLGIDDERTLTNKGREDIKQLADFIFPLNMQVSHILHSQKYRAKETAELLLTGIPLTPPMEMRTELDPMASAEDMLDQINSWHESVMLVGHMPFLGKLASLMCNNRNGQDIILFKPGSMACFEKIEYKQWIITWVINPTLMGSEQKNFNNIV